MKKTCLLFLRLISCRVVVFVTSTLFSLPAVAQHFKFNHYSASNGLVHQYVYDIAQSNSGYLWLATSTGVVRFDGDKFDVYITKNGLAEDFTTRLYVAKNGQMWAGHNQGGVSVYKNGTFEWLLTPSAGFNNIVGFDELPGNVIVAVGQNGKVLIYKNGYDNIHDLSGEDMVVSSMAISGNRTLLLGTDEGLYTYQVRREEPVPTSKKLLESIPREKIQCIVKSTNHQDVLWVATSGGELFKIQALENEEFLVKRITAGSASFEGIQNISEDKKGNLWISSYTGVYKLVPSRNETVFSLESHYIKSNGLPSNQVKCVFHDRDDNIWFGLYGSGLAMLKDEFFVFYQYKSPKFSNNIQTIYFDKEKKYFGTDAGLGCFDCLFADDNFVFQEGRGLEKYSIVALRKFNGTLLAGTAKNGLFAYNAATGKWTNVFFSNSDDLLNSITDMDVTETGIWLGTRGGLYELNGNYTVTRSYTTENGLGHNSINDVFVDKRGRVWASSQSNMVACIDGGQLELLEVMGPSQSININSITQDAQNRIWMGTYGNGIFRQEDKKFVQMSTVNGLASDYCYFIQAGRGNTVWVGHRGALSLIRDGGKKVTVFTTDDGVDNDFNERAVYRDQDGSLWFGSSRGIVKFDPNKYKDNLALPKINIKSILLSDKEVPINKPLELPYGNYRLVISFIGINFNNPQKVKYKYILKGFDLGWSDVSESNQAYYPKLSDGEYEFIVKACNEDGVFSQASAKIKITVAYPFWKQWWFIILGFLALVGLVMGVIALRERNQRIRRIYLENQLQIRTRELVEQKALVELKNKDITDSINYAHKIQSNLLPPVHDMHRYINDFFVLNKPRDIVSGDFYWYDVKGKEFSIAVADCTGHGVPGAFMSAIGNLIFRRVNENMSSIDPALFITEVDSYLTSLMANEQNKFSHDGMDMVLVKIDLETGNVVFSGARRPLLHFSRNGSFKLYKTSMESIGGHTHKKNFTNITFKLEKGDSLYLYSDGIVDQFGGPQMKKIMTKGFIQLIGESLHMNMNDQCNYLNTSFENWHGNASQIDDVLVIGVRYSG